MKHLSNQGFSRLWFESKLFEFHAAVGMRLILQPVRHGEPSDVSWALTTFFGKVLPEILGGGRSVVAVEPLEMSFGITMLS